MKNAIVVCGHKGGPGKSMFARSYLDYARDRGVAVAALDADHNNRSLAQYHGQRGADGRVSPEQDPLRGVMLISLRDARQRDEIVNIAENGLVETILVDLPGGGTEDLPEILGDADQLFRVWEAQGFAPVVVIVCSPIKTSIASVAATIKMFGSRPYYIAVKNLAHGKPHEFGTFDGVVVNGIPQYGAARRLLASVGGDVIEMPALHWETFKALDDNNMTFLDATTARDHLPLADRNRVATYRDLFAGCIDATRIAIAHEVRAVS